MDVTPQELRDIEIRESFRGYHRDEVDELLERAAATIEHLEHEIRVLQERLAAGPAPAPTPAPAARPAPEPVAPPAPAPVPVPDSDVIQRTLILAQMAADEAVADAQARAAHVTGEAEAKAQTLVSEAESTARRIAETERRRIEAEITQLAASRDALTADVDALDKFAAEYRDRIRAAIEAELAHLSQSSAHPEPMPARPPLVTEGMTFTPSTPVASAPPAPAPPAPAPAAPPAPAPTSAPAESAPVGSAPAPKPEPTAVVETVEASDSTAETPAWESEPAEQAAAPEAAWSADQATGWSESDGDASGAEEWRSDSLDDDAFFASLREAVREDEPLGARGEEFFDEDADDNRKLFRRRR
jgi:cell division initiation protein